MLSCTFYLVSVYFVVDLLTYLFQFTEDVQNCIVWTDVQ